MERGPGCLIPCTCRVHRSVAKELHHHRVLGVRSEIPLLVASNCEYLVRLILGEAGRIQTISTRAKPEDDGYNNNQHLSSFQPVEQIEPWFKPPQINFRVAYVQLVN